MNKNENIQYKKIGYISYIHLDITKKNVRFAQRLNESGAKKTQSHLN